MTKMHVSILNPYHAGSHAAWAHGAKSAIEKAGHEVSLHTLPGRHWKWRMHGAAAHWGSLLHDVPPPDLVLTTDMCDVAQLKGLLPRTWSNVRFITMFHENQLTFPWSPNDPDANNGRDNTYAYINLSTAFASDAIWFNSEHHKTVFLEAAGAWLKKMPKPRLFPLLVALEKKCEVFHLGLDWDGWDSAKPAGQKDFNLDTPIILWNHRWAWDKGTEAFMHLVDGILERHIPAEFVVLGQAFERQPEGWDELKEKMGARCLHWGFVEDKLDYVKWLWRSHIAPIHPHQEYFGLSVVEAMRCEVLPWVPPLHAYPETTPLNHPFLPQETWIEALENQSWKTWPVDSTKYRIKALSFGWETRGPLLVDALERVAHSS